MVGAYGPDERGIFVGIYHFIAQCFVSRGVNFVKDFVLFIGGRHDLEGTSALDECPL